MVNSSTDNWDKFLMKIAEIDLTFIRQKWTKYSRMSSSRIRIALVLWYSFRKPSIGYKFKLGSGAKIRDDSQ